MRNFISKGKVFENFRSGGGGGGGGHDLHLSAHSMFTSAVPENSNVVYQYQYIYIHIHTHTCIYIYIRTVACPEKLGDGHKVISQHVITKTYLI